MNCKYYNAIMATVEVNQQQFQFIIILLKYLTSETTITPSENKFTVNLANFRTFVLKKVVMSLEIKNMLLKNFSSLVSSFPKLIFSSSNDTLVISKTQICSLIKPLITKAAINPYDRQKLSKFFQNFACQSEKDEFFLDLLNP